MWPKQKEDEERKSDIINSYLNGITMPKIGIKYGISRQRIEQILKKNKVHRESANKVLIEKHKIEIAKLREIGYKWKEIVSIIDLKVRIHTIMNYIKKDIEFKCLTVKYRSGNQLLCRKCNLIKPREEFHFIYTDMEKKVSDCKSCVKERQQKYKELRRNEKNG